MLLEEAVLFLLRVSGYRTVEQAGVDATLHDGHSGLEVKGRGSHHQIDGVADYVVPQPFSNPSRLLVEAKCYPTRRVGLDVARNAVGMLKDVSEYWTPGPVVARHRYHYQSAIVSATAFTRGAQRYAFAQDVYLIPLGESVFFQPIIAAIQQFADSLHAQSPILQQPDSWRQFRARVRQGIRAGVAPDVEVLTDQQSDAIDNFIESCRRLGFSLLVVIAGRFPIFLTPAEGIDVGELGNDVRVRIFWNQAGWYLQSIEARRLFSFDLPQELLALYAEEGTLTREAALHLKQDAFSTFQAVVTLNNRVRVINFEVDHDWLARLLEPRRRRE